MSLVETIPESFRENADKHYADIRTRLTQSGVFDDGILHPRDHAVLKMMAARAALAEKKRLDDEAAETARREMIMATDAAVAAKYAYDRPKRISIDIIQKVVCERFGISIIDLLSERRRRAVARPRQIAIYFCRKLTTRSLPQIGRQFGGRDHSTCIHSVEVVERLIRDDDPLCESIRSIETKLSGMFRADESAAPHQAIEG